MAGMERPATSPPRKPHGLAEPAIAAQLGERCGFVSSPADPNQADGNKLRPSATSRQRTLRTACMRGLYSPGSLCLAYLTNSVQEAR